MTDSGGNNSVFAPCQQNQINLIVGWAVVQLVAFGEGCDVMGRLEDAVGREPRGLVRVVSLVSHPKQI